MEPEFFQTRPPIPPDPNPIHPTIKFHQTPNPTRRPGPSDPGCGCRGRISVRFAVQVSVAMASCMPLYPGLRIRPAGFKSKRVPCNILKGSITFQSGYLIWLIHVINLAAWGRCAIACDGSTRGRSNFAISATWYTRKRILYFNLNNHRVMHPRRALTN